MQIRALIRSVLRANQHPYRLEELSISAQEPLFNGAKFYSIRLIMNDSKECLFCSIQLAGRERIIVENELAYVIRDGFPVTKFHTLVIPKRHTLDYFGISIDEVLAINSLMHDQKKLLETQDSLIEGYNIGMNCGEVAGQSVWHCHIHLIPRRKGDVVSPKGGVRHVIPNKGHYEEKGV